LQAQAGWWLATELARCADQETSPDRQEQARRQAGRATDGGNLRHFACHRAPTPEISRGFAFSKQALSRHVAILEDAGLVRRTVRGRVHDLTLVRAPLTEVSGWLGEVERGWRTSLDRLDAVLRSRSD
jgi:DNA-binding transcriptional ArsR family regulator